MKRDADLIRDILLSVEAGYDGLKSDITTDQDIINYHLYLAVDAGLLHGQEINEGQWQIYGLAWDGHELLSLIGDDIRWEAIRRVTDDARCYSFWFIRQIAQRLIT